MEKHPDSRSADPPYKPEVRYLEPDRCLHPRNTEPDIDSTASRETTEQDPPPRTTLKQLAVAAAAAIGITGSAHALPPVTGGMVVYLSADNVNPADLTQVRFDGADRFVKQWNDASGNGNHATNTTAADQPEYIAAGLTYTVQFSADLDVWEDSSTPPTLLSGAAGSGDIDAVSVPYPSLVDTANGPQKPTFFRVEVSTAP